MSARFRFKAHSVSSPTRARPEQSHHRCTNDCGHALVFLTKVIIALAAVSLIAVELASPAVTAFELDGDAGDLVESSARQLEQAGFNRQLAIDRMAADYDAAGVDLTGFDVIAPDAEHPTGSLRITFARQAKSIILWRLVPSYYNVEITVSADLR